MAIDKSIWRSWPRCNAMRAPACTYERNLRERLYQIPGIGHSKSSFVLRTLKSGMLPLSLPDQS